MGTEAKATNCEEDWWSPMPVWKQPSGKSMLLQGIEPVLSRSEPDSAEGWQVEDERGGRYDCV